jgi:hypothetical protein
MTYFGIEIHENNTFVFHNLHNGVIFFKYSEDGSSEVIDEYKSIENILEEFAIDIKENIHIYEIFDYGFNNLKAIEYQFPFKKIESLIISEKRNELINLLLKSK